MISLGSILNKRFNFDRDSVGGVVPSENVLIIHIHY